MISIREYKEITTLLKSGETSYEIASRVNVPFETVHAIQIQTTRKKRVNQTMKINARHVKTCILKMEENMTILEYANKHNFPAFVFAKHVLETMLNISMCKITPSFIENLDSQELKEQVIQCIINSDYGGPYSHNISGSVGKYYEYILYEDLQTLNISYLGENELREVGYFVTPDVKLVTPLYLVDFDMVVTWIESKAFFGDEFSHKKNYEQYTKYYNRHGPGLVIYWFGCLDDLNTDQNHFICLDHMPKNVATLSSTQEESNNFDMSTNVK